MKRPVPLRLQRPAGGGGSALAALQHAAQLLEVPLAALAANPENPSSRTEEGAELEQLVASVRAVGLLQPVTVAPVEGWSATHPDAVPVGAEYVLLDGHRRVEAARRAGLTAVPAFVRAGTRAAEVLLHANQLRRDLTPMEEAAAYQRLLDAGMTQTEIADRLGVAQSTVSKRVALLGLPPVVQAAIQSGVVRPAEALAVKDEPALDQVTAEDLPVVGLSSALGRARTRVRVAVVQEAVAEEAARRGCDVVDPRTAFGRHAWRRELRDPAAIDAAEAAGHLVVGAGWDRPVYYTTGPLPVDPAAEEEAQSRRARQNRRRFLASTLPTARFTAAELTQRLVQHLLGAAVGDEAVVLAHRWLVPGAERDHHYAWRSELLDASPAEQQRAAWVLSWAAREVSSHRYPSPAYLADLVALGYTPTAWEQAILDKEDR